MLHFAQGVSLFKGAFQDCLDPNFPADTPLGGVLAPEPGMGVNGSDYLIPPCSATETLQPNFDNVPEVRLLGRRLRFSLRDDSVCVV